MEKKCIECNQELGKIKRTLKNGATRESDYFNKTPKIIDGIKYYRNKCQKCLALDKFPAPNLLGYVLGKILGIPEEVTTNFVKSKSVTKENLQKKYGKELGNQKFQEYCEKQSYTNTLEYKQKKYGWTEKEFDNFNKSRATTLDVMVKKYGKELGNQKFQEYCEKQSYTNTLEYFEEKHGKDGRIKWQEYNKKKALNLENFIKKYGKEVGVNKFLSYRKKQGERLANQSKIGVSPISQELFLAIYDEIKSISNKIYFSDLNKEFHRYDQTNDKNYFYDFVISDIRFAIEFNGEHCHPNREILSEKEWLTWKNPWTGELADECFIKDKRKIECLTEKDFFVKIVWCSDYINNKQKIVRECINEIKQRTELFKRF